MAKKNSLKGLNKWIKLEPWVDAKCSCPECGDAYIDYEFVGFRDSRMGYAMLWCPACEKGIHISRLKVPEGVSMLSFEQAEAGEGKVKPKIKLVH